ncbi:CDP-paratose 2-epimerase [bacterium]|nr:MAG: CDP-paratose 2-epimerase [bacterium]
MKLNTLKRQQLIRQPLEETFSFFSHPENLAMLTPASLEFQMLTPAPIEMKEGAVIDYTVRPFIFPLRWTTFITDFKPPHRFADLQLRGPYAYWHHAHTFTETDDGTMMTDEIHYALPFGLLGKIAHALFVRRQLDMIFDFRKATLETVFPDTAASTHIAVAARSTNRRTIRTSRRKRTS